MVCILSSQGDLHEHPKLSPKALEAKRSSALIDARSVEAKLGRLSNSTATVGKRTNLLSVAGMLRDYIATLDEAIAGSVVKIRDLPALRH